MSKQQIIAGISLVLTLAICAVDFFSAASLSLVLLYAVPVLTASRFCGRMSGMLVAALAATCWFAVAISHNIVDGISAIASWNFLAQLGIFMLIAYSFSLQAKLMDAYSLEHERACRDHLTGLLNNRAFRERVEMELERARRYHHPITLAYIDIDNFKAVNDTQGHVTGDNLLKQIGRTISSAARKTDIAGRLGGDEFAIFFPETNGEQAKKAVAKLVTALNGLDELPGVLVTASIGVVTCSGSFGDFDELVGEADDLMYQVKGSGKNAAVFS